MEKCPHCGNSLRAYAEQLEAACAEVERAQRGEADQHMNMLVAEDMISKTHEVLSAAKVPPCDGDEREFDLDQRVGELVRERNGLRQELELALGPHCDGCGNSIDPDWCHCGSAVASHGMGDGHGPVPMGCVCGYHDEDFQRLAKSRGELLWKQHNEMRELRQQLAALQAEKDEATGVVRRLMVAVPRPGEFESLESHVRWLETKHGWDSDASPVAFIKRALTICSCASGAIDGCPYHDPDLDVVTIGNCQSPSTMSTESRRALVDIETAAIDRFGSLDSSVRAVPNCEAPFCTNWNPCEPCERALATKGPADE